MNYDMPKKCLKRKHPFSNNNSGDSGSEDQAGPVPSTESDLCFVHDVVSSTRVDLGFQEPGVCSDDSSDDHRDVFDDDVDEDDEATGQDSHRQRRRRSKKERKVALTEEEAESKRILANSQERDRMNRLNRALFNLRNALPAEFSVCNRRLSKIRTLRLAVRYIRNLTEMLAEDDALMRQSYPGWFQHQHQYQYPYYPATPPHPHPGHPVMAVQPQMLFPSPALTFAQQSAWPQAEGHSGVQGDEGYFSFNDSLPAGHVISPHTASFGPLSSQGGGVPGPSPQGPYSRTSLACPGGRVSNDVHGNLPGLSSCGIAGPLPHSLPGSSSPSIPGGSSLSLPDSSSSLCLPGGSPYSLPDNSSSLSLPDSSSSYGLPGYSSAHGRSDACPSQRLRVPFLGKTTPVYNDGSSSSLSIATPSHRPCQAYPTPHLHPHPPSTHTATSHDGGFSSVTRAANANVSHFLSSPATSTCSSIFSPWMSSTPAGGYFTGRVSAGASGSLLRTQSDSGNDVVESSKSSCVFSSTPVEQRQRTTSTQCPRAADQSWPPLCPPDLSPL